MVLPFARPWRHPRTGMYWFRRRVPTDLRFLLGRNEERRTLATKEPGLARTRYLAVAAEVDERWSRLRSALAAQADAAGPSDRGAKKPDSGTECLLPPGGPIGSPVQGMSGAPLRPILGIPPTSADVAQPAPAPWREILEAYAAETKPAPSTVKRWTGVLAALEEVLGTDDLARVDRADLVAWKASLLASGRDPRTVRDAYLAGVKAVMNWATANGRLSLNPAMGILVKVPRKPTVRDREFTDEEASTILRATAGPHDGRLSREHAAARRWIPWLCAYGGARVNEMTQLRGRDVRRERGIWVLRITPDAGTVKTGRWRDVPLHPHLVEQGFPLFVGNRGPGPLFYDPARGRGGQAAHPIYKKVGERLAAWVRRIGVDDHGVDPNHGWRHRFKTVGRRAGIPSDVLDAIQGHSPRNEGGRYGRVPIEVMFAAVSRLPRYDRALDADEP